MTNPTPSQTATTSPTRTEAAMIVSIMALLIINLAATIRAANYEPECMSAIIEIERTPK